MGKTRAERRREIRKAKKHQPFWITKPKLIAGAALAALAVFGGVVYCQSRPVEPPNVPKPSAAFSPTPVVYKNFLDQVRAGTYDSRLYIAEMAERSDKLRNAINDGIVLGVLYNPSTEELTEKLRTLLTGRVAGEELEGMIASHKLKSSSIADGKLQHSTNFPKLVSLYGSGIPGYIALPESFLNNPIIATDDEVVSVLEHERNHVADQFNSISYPNVSILTKQDFESGDVSVPFLEALVEVRAYHKQLEGILRTVSGLENKRFTDPFITANAINYSEYLKELGLNAKTPKEKAIKDAQIEETKSIIPLEQGNTLTLRFFLNGRDGEITFLRK